MLDFLVLAKECAPTVAPQTMAAIVSVESNYNPYAIGVVGGYLERQPKNKAEAIETAKVLHGAGWNFSVGVAQVNRYNLPKYNITYEQAFDSCTNLRIGSKILEECYVRASKKNKDEQSALQSAFSCYYSGNFTRGFKPDELGKPSYVQKVLNSAKVVSAGAISVVPSINTNLKSKPMYDKAASIAVPVVKNSKQGKAKATVSDIENTPVLLSKRKPVAAAKTFVIGNNESSNESSNEVAVNSAIVF